MHGFSLITYAWACYCCFGFKFNNGKHFSTSRKEGVDNRTKEDNLEEMTQPHRVYKSSRTHLVEQVVGDIS